MGQIFSWIRGARDTPALRDVSVEAQSQSKQTTPTPAAQVSTVKQAQYEKGSASTTAAAVAKPAASATPAATTTVTAPATTTATTTPLKTSTSSTAAATTVGTTPTVTPTVTTVGSTGAAGKAVTQKESPKVKPEAGSVSPAKAAPVNPTDGAASKAGVVAGVEKSSADVEKPKVASKDAAQSASIPSSKSEPAKQDPATAVSGAGAPKGPDVKAKESKVQVEVGPPAAKTTPAKDAFDPLDALAGTLPPSEPLAPTAPIFTGPEVKEHDITAEKGVLCGERESTLPPGYRFENLDKKPAGVPEMPKETPKPMSTDEALDSLSAGFMLSPAPAAENKETNVASASAGFSNFAPPPPSSQKKAEVSVPAAVSKSPAPPADKKAKIEQPADDFSLAAGLSSPPPQTEKPKTDKGSSMSSDALSALEDLLPAAEPTPEPPKLKPEEIVTEEKLASEKGVRVGEREDTLPPDYRFSEEKLKDLPAPKKEPSLDSDAALDLLSGDFTSSSAAPAVQAPVPTAPPKQPRVEDLSALDALASDFVAPTQAPSKIASVPTAANTAPPSKSGLATDEGSSMSSDALSALEDLLPAAEPTPEPPKLKPEEIVTEEKLASEKGVRVGEREDTLPPDYRFSEEKLKDLPAPKKEPSLDSDAALDLLSGDFTSSSAAPAVQAPVPTAPPKQTSTDFALDDLAADFATPTVASNVQSAVTGPGQTGCQLSEDPSSALDALSDTLKDIAPAPAPVPGPVKDTAQEKKVVEERIVKMGERDDSLPPEYQPTEADKKAMAEAKAKADATPKQKSMDDTEALDLLSSDFSAPPAPVAPSAPAAAAAPQTKTSVPAADASVDLTTKGPVLDKLAGTLIPGPPEVKQKESKPKGRGGKTRSKSKKQAVEDTSATGLSGQMSTDVVVTSSTKKGGKS
ncbi:calpastatin isoform X1 [Chanos chanos]|uniref:Calpastatin n=1 Tax=Chanos chanos TaxID=29144 RepID=A0A6J2V200_CHACN|nr:calpastatin isoform X1 [Chanos chanos]